MIDPHHIWNVIYNAQSNKRQPPTSANIALATQSESHDWSASHMKHHLQCAEQQASPSNFPKNCACHAKWLSWLIHITYETSFTMRGATVNTLQPHQILRLPRKMNLMIDPHHIWNVIYNARSNSQHPPTSPNTAPATQNESHDWSASHMKRHLQCAEQQSTPSNLTKYCACHAKWPPNIRQKFAENRWNRVRRASRKPGPGPGPNPAGRNPQHSSWWHAFFRYFDSFWTGFGCQRLKKYSNLADSNHVKCIILPFWRVILISFGQVLASKNWQSNQIWLIPIISILSFWSPSLVTLIPFGQVLAAKDWKSIQIWLIHIISILTFCLFWFGDFDSFWTGFGCQRVKKYSNLADSNHFNSVFLLFWFGEFDSFWTRLGCRSLKKYSKLADSHHFNSIVLIS